MLDAWFYAMVYICQSKGLDHLYKLLVGPEQRWDRSPP
jgi:hypothetical protein